MTEQIQQMQRLQMAGTLAGGIAHDLNNELTLILGHLDLAMDQLPSEDEACDLLRNAKSAASRCADMTRRLLTISRGRSSAMTKFDAAAAVAEARQCLEYIKPAHVRITADITRGLLMTGNANQIQQAVMELGANSFAAMRGGGELQITAQVNEGEIRISVRDTGCGMSQALQKRMFEPFFSTHSADGGSGLGLSMVRSIVSHHHGMMGFDSKLHQGSVFVLTFTAWQPEPEPGSEPEPGPEYEPENERGMDLEEFEMKGVR